MHSTREDFELTEEIKRGQRRVRPAAILPQSFRPQPMQRRLAGLNPVSKSLVKHADRTELHCFRKLVTATGAGTLGLRTHGPNRPSVAF